MTSEMPKESGSAGSSVSFQNHHARGTKRCAPRYDPKAFGTSEAASASGTHRPSRILWTCGSRRLPQNESTANATGQDTTLLTRLAMNQSPQPYGAWSSVLGCGRAGMVGGQVRKWALLRRRMPAIGAGCLRRWSMALPAARGGRPFGRPSLAPGCARGCGVRGAHPADVAFLLLVSPPTEYVKEYILRNPLSVRPATAPKRRQTCGSSEP